MTKKFLLILLLLLSGLMFLECESLGSGRNVDEGICWYADRNMGWVAKISSDGDRVLLRYMDVVEPVAVAMVPLDGSVWVCDTGTHELVHIDLDGQTLKRVAGFAQPIALAIDPYEADVWVVDTGTKQLIKVGPRGSILKVYSGLSNPQAVTIDYQTSEVWVADGGNGLIKFDSDANPLTQITGLGFVADVTTDVDDGRVYVCDPTNNKVFCLSPEGNLIWIFTGDTDLPLQRPTKVQAAPGDTVWVLETDAHRIRRIGSAGLVTLTTRENLENPVCIATSWQKDEIWVGDIDRHRVIRNSKSAEAKAWVGGLGQPVSLSIYDPDLERK